MEESGLFADLLRAKSKIPPIPKSKEGYGYKYAPLEVVYEAIKKPLCEEGLYLYDRIVQPHIGVYGIETSIVLARDPSQVISSYWPITAANGRDIQDPQVMGASITYGRRYNIVGLLGLAAEDDTDGVQASSPTTPAAQAQSKSQAGEYVIQFGKHKGARIKDIAVHDLAGYIDFLVAGSKADGKPLSRNAKDLMLNFEVWVANTKVDEIDYDGDPGPSEPQF